MANFSAIRAFVERDGRYRLLRLETFYLDPERDPVEGKDPIFGAMLRRSRDVFGRDPVIIVPIDEGFVDDDPRTVARTLLREADKFSGR